MDDANPTSAERGSVVVLLAFVAVCLGVSAIGTAITWSSIETWYPTLLKPWFAPPDWVFAPVWSAIYVGLAVAAWRIWALRDRPGAALALFWFSAQLTLNLLWTVLFFGLRSPAAAAVEIFVLLLAVGVTTIAFMRLDRLAGWLFVPYLAWTAFAAVITVGIWHIN